MKASITFGLISLMLTSCLQNMENSFQEINESLEKSGDSLVNRMAHFEHNGPINKERKELLAFMESMRTSILSEIDPEAESIRTAKNLINYAVPTRILIEEGKGKELKARIHHFQDAIRKGLKQNSPLMRQYQIDLSPVSSAEGLLEPWEESQFKRIPAIAVFTNFSKIESELNTLYLAYKKEQEG